MDELKDVREQIAFLECDVVYWSIKVAVARRKIRALKQKCKKITGKEKQK